MCGCRGDLESWAELLEATRRQLGGGGDKLEQSRHLLGLEPGHDQPEPGHHRLEVRAAASIDHCMFLEVFIANTPRSTHKQLL